MSFNYPKAGASFVPSYQVSGIPFVTSSIDNEVPGPDSDSASAPISISFPHVTKFITVRNTGGNALRVGFTANGVIAPGERLANNNDKPNDQQRNFFLVPTGSSGAHGDVAGSIQTFDVRCTQVFFLSHVTEASNPTTVANSTSFSLIAGLTNIEATQFPALTGSNGFEGVG